MASMDKPETVTRQSSNQSGSDEGTAYDPVHVDQRRPSYYDVHHTTSVSGPVMAEADAKGGKAMCAMLMYHIVVIGASAFLYGYDNAIVSPVAALEPFVERYQGPNPTTGQLVFTANNQSLVFSLPLAGSVLGALCAPWFQVKYGRKWPLIGSYIFGLGGNFLQIFAPNLTAFVVGRFWGNFASGIGAATAPLYLAEVAPAAIRGAAVASSNILALLSAVLAALVVLGSHYYTGPSAYLSYKLPLGIQAVPTGVLLPFTFFLADSPQWLASKDRMTEARQCLRKVRGYSDALLEDELRVMKMTEDSQRAQMSGLRFWHLFNKENFERTIVAGSMFSFNQLSGIILTSTYATVFIKTLGVGDPYVFTVIAQVCILLGTLVAPFTMDRSGRRPTALSGMAVLLVIDIVCGVLAFFAGPNNKAAGLALVSFSMVFNFFWAASFYSISNLLPSEIASVKMRPYTMAYTIAWAQTTAVITTFAIPQITAEDGANLGAKAYLIFAGCMALIITFVFFLVPETKGRTFAEIDELYARNVPRRQWVKAQTSTNAKHASIIPNDEFRRATVAGSVQFDLEAAPGLRRKSVFTGIAEGGASGSERPNVVQSNGKQGA